jgi:hypothetical protein
LPPSIRTQRHHRRARPAPSGAVGLLAVLLVLVAGCGGEPEPPAPDEVVTIISEPTLGAGDEVPPPNGEPVLTLSGRISTTNVDDTLQFDLETLERLGVVELEVDDHQAEGGEIVTQGVLLSDVLAIAQVDPDATEVMTIALNDYEYPIPLSDPDEYAVLVVTAVDGERLSVERFGPLRIVYPNLDVEFDPTEYDPRWTWQLDRLDVR